jgi:hypothetical protein
MMQSQDETQTRLRRVHKKEHLKKTKDLLVLSWMKVARLSLFFFFFFFWQLPNTIPLSIWKSGIKKGSIKQHWVI